MPSSLGMTISDITRSYTEVFNLSMASRPSIDVSVS